MSRPRVTGFVHPTSGEWCELRDPDGPPTARQLLRLNAAGRLALVAVGDVAPLSKAECAAALDGVTEANAEVRLSLADELARTLVEHGPTSGTRLAAMVHRRKGDVPAALRTDPRFVRVGRGNRTRWRLVTSAAESPQERAREPLGPIPSDSVGIPGLDALNGRLATLEARVADLARRDRQGGSRVRIHPPPQHDADHESAGRGRA